MTIYSSNTWQQFDGDKKLRAKNQQVVTLGLCAAVPAAAAAGPSLIVARMSSFARPYNVLYLRALLDGLSMLQQATGFWPGLEIKMKCWSNGKNWPSNFLWRLVLLNKSINLSCYIQSRSYVYVHTFERRGNHFLLFKEEKFLQRQKERRQK